MFQGTNENYNNDIKNVEENEKSAEVAKPQVNKNEWKIIKDIKQELDDSATQQIEEFQTQDIDFGDDFSNDSVKPSEVKKEEQTIPTSLTDVADEFLNDEFELFPKKKLKEPVKLTSTWSEQICDDQQTVASVQIEGNTLPLQTNQNGEKVLRFYWLDAWEDKFVKPGVVFLFGKVYADPGNKKAGVVSCCLIVKNVNRKLYLLPREYVSINYIDWPAYKSNY